MKCTRGQTALKHIPDYVICHLISSDIYLKDLGYFVVLALLTDLVPLFS